MKEEGVLNIISNMFHSLLVHWIFVLITAILFPLWILTKIVRIPYGIECIKFDVFDYAHRVLEDAEEKISLWFGIETEVIEPPTNPTKEVVDEACDENLLTVIRDCVMHSTKKNARGETVEQAKKRIFDRLNNERKKKVNGKEEVIGKVDREEEKMDQERVIEKRKEGKAFKKAMDKAAETAKLLDTLKEEMISANVGMEVPETEVQIEEKIC